MTGIKIEISNLNLTLFGNSILRDINLTINPGEIHCFVGPNGGGKTSLLKCILGQVPFTGSIRMEYEDDKVIGYVPQNVDFDKTLPMMVEDFMGITCGNKPCFLGLADDKKDVIYEVLKKLSIYEKRKRLLGNLSGGEKQRVFLAQALYPKPNLLILDEPLTGIDKKGEKYFKEILNELKKEGITVIWIHHNLLQVRELADKVTCIKGRIMFSGNAKDELTDEKIVKIFE